MPTLRSPRRLPPVRTTTKWLKLLKPTVFSISGAELIKYAAEQTAELSDEQLEAVAGGTWTGGARELDYMEGGLVAGLTVGVATAAIK